MCRPVALALLGAVCFGQQLADPKIDFEKHVLANGLQLILHVDRKLPMVNVNLWFHVGSKNERVGRSGFAHLFEHMMFEGSKNAPKKYFEYAERAGANVFEGGVNGTTDWDRTNYFITVPSGSLEYALWLESDRLATLAEAVNEERFKNQRDVVRNERRQGLENRPYGRWIKLVSENLYPYRHPYANDVIGTHEDLIAATLDDIKEFFRSYYTPNNLSLTIAGDFDAGEAKRLVEKYFGGISPGPALDRPARWLQSLEGERTVEVRDRVPQERTYFAWLSPAFFEAGDAELDLAAIILTDGIASRLQKVLVYDKRLCSDLTSFQMSREASSAFIITATARPGAPLADIEKIVTVEIARLGKEGPSEAELVRARNRWEYQFISNLERIGGFGGKADMLNQYNVFLGDPGRFQADLARHRDVTAATLRNAVAKWLDTRNRLLVRFLPERSGRPAEIALDRSKEPALATGSAFQAPSVQTAKLDNGLEVLVVERRDLPKVAVTFVSRTGSADDTSDKAGLADLTVSVMRMGTRTRNAIQIDESMGELGAAISGNADRERSTVGFEVLKRNLGPALTILADVVRNPVFPDSEVDLQKKRRLDALSREERDASGLARRIGPMLTYGKDHPYGRPRNGLPATVAKLTRGDFARFHSTYWKPGSSALILVGDVTLSEATALTTRIFGDWPSGARPVLKIPEPRPLGPGKAFLVDRQDAAQTMVMQIASAPPRKSEEYYALRLADAVWGGAVGSRLNRNLREEKGYSYGVFSFLFQFTQAGSWVASGTVQTDKTKESVVEFVKELLFIAGEKPATEQELAYAKANRIRGYAQQFESLGRIAGRVAELWALSLPMSELQREPAELEKATLEAVNAVAKKYAAPKDVMLLLVGDLAKIEPGVREVVKGQIVKLDVSGNVIAR